MDAFQKEDSIGLYLTGASSDAGSQSDPALSLGNYRSSTEISSIKAIVRNPIVPLRFDKFSDACGVGEAGITGDGQGFVQFTPPDGNAGASQSITSGQSIILFGSDTSKWVRVVRETGNTILGSSVLTLARNVNGAIAMGDVNDAARQAGSAVYRCVAIYNHSPSPVVNVKAWLTVTGCQSTYSIGKQITSSNAVQTIANESTAPTAIPWASPTAKGSALSIASIASGDWYGLWIRRVFPASGVVSLDDSVGLNLEYEGR